MGVKSGEECNCYFKVLDEIFEFFDYCGVPRGGKKPGTFWAVCPNWFFCENVQDIAQNAEELRPSRWMYFFKLLTGGNWTQENETMFFKLDIMIRTGILLVLIIGSLRPPGRQKSWDLEGTKVF